MKELVHMIINALVDHEDQIQINEIVGEKTLMYEVRVAESDVGKIIGRNGKTINSIRTLLRAATVKDNKKVILEVLQ
jgi:hypothetical protein